MTKYQIPNLLEELKSDETYIRNDAIKKIIKGKINNEQIIFALREVIENDPSTAVRNFAQSALNAALNTPPLTQDEMDITDEKSDNEIAGKVDRFRIPIRAIILVSGSLFILFKIHEYFVYLLGGGTYPIWLYLLTGAVLVGLIYYLDNTILPNKSKDKNTKPGSSAGLISGLALTIGLGIPTCLLTISLYDNPAAILVPCFGPIVLTCFIGAIIFFRLLGKLLS